MNQTITEAFSTLSTPLIADACVRLEIPLRIVDAITALNPAFRVAGRVLPVAHAGSVDIFLEAMETAERGDVLVIDNEGRVDEGCIGDLTVLEAISAGLAGIVVWGRHRDSRELLDIGLPVFSTGTCPAGPVRVDRRRVDATTRAAVNGFSVTADDVVFGDLDGVLFVPADRVEEILATATTIWDKEREQARRARAGETLRDQLQFSSYMAKRAQDPSVTFRAHLREIGGAIEE